MISRELAKKMALPAAVASLGIAAVVARIAGIGGMGGDPFPQIDKSSEAIIPLDDTQSMQFSNHGASLLVKLGDGTVESTVSDGHSSKKLSEKLASLIGMPVKVEFSDLECHTGGLATADLHYWLGQSTISATSGDPGDKSWAHVTIELEPSGSNDEIVAQDIPLGHCNPLAKLELLKAEQQHRLVFHDYSYPVTD